MVPVLDSNKQPLMPCSRKKSQKINGKRRSDTILANWYLFCIKLTKEPSDRQYQEVSLGIDTGSKREGYTIATSKSVVLNITTNTPYWVKQHMRTRRLARKDRRRRNTPYRKCRVNRASMRSLNYIPPSTKARWNAKLRIIKQLLKIISITIINVEDIKATTKKDKVKWNQSFSPLQIGKNYFYTEIEALKIKLIKNKRL